MCTDTGQAYMFPTSVKEVERLGWDFIDVILFSGDAFIDHPSSGTAMIARVLQREGYRVAVVPQPNWQDDLRDFRKLGAPRLFFGVNSGAMDSMVNHYTAARRLRSDDAYTPGGRAGHRPDYAVTVYTRILKRLYPHVPVVIGGIEASLRLLAGPAVSISPGGQRGGLSHLRYGGASGGGGRTCHGDRSGYGRDPADGVFCQGQGGAFAGRQCTPSFI